MKPFECVGTFNEAKAALHLTLLKYHEKHSSQRKNEKNSKTDMNMNVKNVCFDSTKLPIVLLNMIKFVDLQNGCNEDIAIRNNGNDYKDNDDNNNDDNINNRCKNNDGDEDNVDEDSNINNIKKEAPIVIDRRTFLDEGEDSKKWIPRFVNRTPVVMDENDDGTYISIYT
jgi:hypothetical protein